MGACAEVPWKCYCHTLGWEVSSQENWANFPNTKVMTGFWTHWRPTSILISILKKMPLCGCAGVHNTVLVISLYPLYNKHITKWPFWNCQKSYKEVCHAYQLLVICLQGWIFSKISRLWFWKSFWNLRFCGRVSIWDLWKLFQKCHQDLFCRWVFGKLFAFRYSFTYSSQILLI